MSSTKKRSPVVDAQIERAMRPYLDRLPPDVLAEMRAMLEDMLLSHPVVSGWVERLGDAPRLLTSADIPRDGATGAPVGEARVGDRRPGRR